MKITQATNLFEVKKSSLTVVLLNAAGWLSYCVFWVILMLTLQSLWSN